MNLSDQYMDHHTTLSSSAERCSSCESGWTDYLISPVQSADEVHMVDYTNSYGSGEGDGYDNSIREKYQEADDNDSLTSDASSGPSHRKGAGKNSRNCRNMKAEKEKIEIGMKERSGGSSGRSSKIELNTVRKERSVDRKDGSQWKGNNVASVSYGTKKQRG